MITINYFKKILFKYIGTPEYIVTAVNVSGQVEKYICNTKKEVDAAVIEINNDIYWDVQKIEKFRRYDFSYKNEIIHSPLHFCLDDVTEEEYVIDHNYSFLKKHDSLENIKRVSSK